MLGHTRLRQSVMYVDEKYYYYSFYYKSFIVLYVSEFDPESKNSVWGNKN